MTQVSADIELDPSAHFPPPSVSIALGKFIDPIEEGFAVEYKCPHCRRLHAQWSFTLHNPPCDRSQQVWVRPPEIGELVDLTEDPEPDPPTHEQELTQSPAEWWASAGFVHEPVSPEFQTLWDSIDWDVPLTPDEEKAGDNLWDEAAERYLATIAPERKAEIYMRSVSEDAKVFDPWEVLPPPAFDPGILPPILREFVISQSKAMGCDPAGLAWACLSACSAAIHGRTRLRMTRKGNWTVPAPIWTAVIGDPSSKKTPTLEAALAPLAAIQAADIQLHRKAKAVWSALPADKKKETPEPKIDRRLISQDGTTEAIQQILSEQDRGLAVVRDELAGWITNFDRYSGGKGGGDRAYYLESYNGGAFAADRVGRGLIASDNLLLTILGGMQPDRLMQFHDLTDDGFMQRLTMILIKGATLGDDDAYDEEAAKDYASLISLLVNRRPQTPCLSAGAIEVRERIERRMHDLTRIAPYENKFATYCGKLTGLFGRLCLVLHMIDPQWDTNDDFMADAVGLSTALTAELLMDFAYQNALTIYQTIESAGEGDRTMKSIARYILRKETDKGRVLVSELTRNVRDCRGKSRRDIQMDVAPLIAGGWLEQQGNDFFRDPKGWAVNPIVYKQFAGMALDEKACSGKIREQIQQDVARRREEKRGMGV